MSGYSGTPLPKKLGIKDGMRVAFLREPDGFRDVLEKHADLARGVAISTRIRVPRNASGGAGHARSSRGNDGGTWRRDVIVAFFKRRVELERGFDRLMEALNTDGGLWIAWPKRKSDVASDITEDVVRELALERGMVDNKVCAIDETWSGLRLVYRRENRPGLRARRAAGPPAGE